MFCLSGCRLLYSGASCFKPDMPVFGAAAAVATATDAPVLIEIKMTRPMMYSGACFSRSNRLLLLIASHNDPASIPFNA